MKEIEAGKKRKKKSIYSFFTKVFIVFTVIGIIAWGGLYAFNYSIGGDKEQVTNEDGTTSTVTVQKKKILNLLFCGENQELTDTMIYVKYNTETAQVSMMSIPRDTYITNQYAAGHKLNSIYIVSGINPLVTQIEELLDVKMDYYVVVSNKIVQQVVDAVGGVEIEVPIRMKYDDPTQNLHIDLKPGVQVLNGAKAEQFIRFRKGNDGSGYRMGDLERTQVQQKFIKAFIATVLSPKNITNIPQVINVALKNTDTNVTAREALRYATDIAKIKTDNIISLTAPGEAKYIDDISYFVMDEKETQRIIKEEFDAPANNTQQENPTNTGDNLNTTTP